MTLMKTRTDAGRMGRARHTDGADLLVHANGVDLLVHANGADLLVHTNGADLLVHTDGADLLVEPLRKPASRHCHVTWGCIQRG